MFAIASVCRFRQFEFSSGAYRNIIQLIFIAVLHVELDEVVGCLYNTQPVDVGQIRKENPQWNPGPGSRAERF